MTIRQIIWSVCFLAASLVAFCPMAYGQCCSVKAGDEKPAACGITATKDSDTNVNSANDPCVAVEAGADTAAGDVDPGVIRMLERVEARGAALRSFQADMLYKSEQPLIDTLNVRNGKLYYRVHNETVHFRLHFSDLQSIDLEYPEESPDKSVFDEDISFDGCWAMMRNARTRSIRRREVSKTPADRESFRLGKGMFPLPFAVRKDDVLKEFNVSLPKADPNDPAGTFRLHLVPKPEGAFSEKYRELDLWIESASNLARQIRYSTDNEEIVTVLWSKIIVDKSLSDNLFELKPAGPGWDIEVERLDGGP